MFAEWNTSRTGGLFRRGRRDPTSARIVRHHRRLRHSSYVRQIQDLPDQGSPVILSVQLDRWRCQNPHCGRKTFVARLPGTIARPRARRTDRVIQLVKLFAYTAGGRPAERLMAKLGIPVSNDTLLRHLKRHQGRRPVAAIPARVVGVDDWSWVKGESYGTIFGS